MLLANSNLDGKKNIRQNPSFFDFSNMLNDTNNNNNNNSNQNNLLLNNVLNNDSLKLICQLLTPNSNNHSNNNYANGNSNHFISNGHLNSQESGFMRTSNLISELINLEQQNKIQIELIQSIIQTKYKNTSHINNFLVHLINNMSDAWERNDNDATTTKSSSRSNENNLDKNASFKNPNLPCEINSQETFKGIL